MPMYLSFIEPASSFSLNYAIGALAAPMIGGSTHWLGPVIGALLLASLQQLVTVTISSEINVLVVGVLLVLFVVLAPEGILGLFRGRNRRTSRRPRNGGEGQAAPRKWF
jgi:branched-chain amino acid transport system permease protein